MRVLSGERATNVVKGQTLALSAAMIGLICVTGCAPSPVDPPVSDPSLSIERSDDPVVARVDGSPIYRLDVRRAAEAQGLIGAEETLEVDDSVFKTVLDELIDQRLLALDALRTGVASDQEAKRRLAAAQDRILGNYRVETHLAETVTETAIRELYEAQRALAGQGEERQLRRIVLPDQATALEVAARLADEEDFETLIEDYVEDPSRLNASGDMGWLSRNSLSGAVAAQAFSTPIGGRSAPFQVGETWQIIEVLDVRAPLSRSFSDVRDDIERFMTYEAVQSLMTDLRDRAEIDRVNLEALSEASDEAQNDTEQTSEDSSPE